MSSPFFEYPPRRKNAYSRLKNTDYQMRQERRKPVLPGPYVYVGDYVAHDSPSNDPPVVSWQSPVWQNSFTWYGNSYVGFRHGLDGYVEFIGRLDLTAGAVTGTVAFTLPSEYRAISFDYTFPVYAGGTDWAAGVMSVNPLDDGDVYVYWPVLTTAP